MIVQNVLMEMDFEKTIDKLMKNVVVNNYDLFHPKMSCSLSFSGM